MPNYQGGMSGRSRLNTGSRRCLCDYLQSVNGSYHICNSERHRDILWATCQSLRPVSNIPSVMVYLTKGTIIYKLNLTLYWRRQFLFITDFYTICFTYIVWGWTHSKILLYSRYLLRGKLCSWTFPHAGLYAYYSCRYKCSCVLLCFFVSWIVVLFLLYSD